LGEITGVLAAVLSSALGGSSIGATRYLAGVADPLAIGSFRFGIGVLLLAPLAMLGGGRWPERRDWLGVAGLGLLFFALFPLLFNASLIYTTAARGALALSTLPLLTMAVGAGLGVVELTWRKTIGVLIAMLGVVFALLAGFGQAPPGAWRGDLLMVAAALCMALYGVWSKPFIRRSGPIPFTVVAMGVGAACLTALGCARGSFAAVAAFGAAQWIAALYLGALGGALTFFLWAFALKHTTPTRVAISISVNPIVASLVGAFLLREPLSLNLVAGIVAVFMGIALATRPDSIVDRETRAPPAGRAASAARQFRFLKQMLLGNQKLCYRIRVVVKRSSGWGVFRKETGRGDFLI
jgi:drug/metabolite transporter (DMT)-like permease